AGRPGVDGGATGSGPGCRLRRGVGPEHLWGATSRGNALMPTDKLRPEEIDAAIAASQRQGRRHGLRLDPDDLTAIEASYRTRERRDANDPDFGLRDSLGGAAREPEAGEPGIPPYPERSGPEFVYAEREEDLSGGRRRRPWPMLVAGLALGAFAAIIWWAYGTEPPGESGP